MSNPPPGARSRCGEAGNPKGVPVEGESSRNGERGDKVPYAEVRRAGKALRGARGDRGEKAVSAERLVSSYRERSPMAGSEEGRAPYC